MSRAELIEFVDRSALEDRLFLQAYIEHISRESDPENGRELDRRLDAMRQGNEVYLDDVWKLHEALLAQGL